MKILTIVLIITFAMLLLFFLSLLICFKKTFYVTQKQKNVNETEPISGEIYLPYHNIMKKWMEELKTFNGEEIYITSFDGLKLHGTYYEKFKDAPIEIMFHGYRGNSKRDLCGGVQRCFKLGRNALTVDQRSQGRSQGKIITFGVKERYDVVSWVNYCTDRFGKQVQIYLTGISMGASTVLSASSFPFPENVKGIVADCGYSNAKDIIKSVITKMHLPFRLLYPLIKLSAKIFGKFDLEAFAPETELKKTKLPVLFMHGNADDFVPHTMSEKNYNACISKKTIVIFNGAGHGLSYPVNPEKYLSAMREFEKYCN